MMLKKSLLVLVSVLAIVIMEKEEETKEKGLLRGIRWIFLNKNLKVTDEEKKEEPFCSRSTIKFYSDSESQPEPYFKGR